MDPQTVKLPGADPLTADALGKFRVQTAATLADLTSARGVAPMAAQSLAAAAGARPNSGVSDKAFGSTLPAGFSVAGMAQYVGEPRGAVN
jgi:hypothetical protein